ncbi:MAG: methyltransferase domain-containing protein [Parcubacteria group bacterium]
MLSLVASRHAKKFTQQAVTVDLLKEKLSDFEASIARARKAAEPVKFVWYPYGSLSNVVHLDRLLGGKLRDLSRLAQDKPVADIGAADGDFGFLLEQLGLTVDIIDYAATNSSHLEGARTLKRQLKSKIKIYDIDLDSQFALPRRDYGLVIFLGILYHLKNPFYAMERLAMHADYCLVSTRIAQFSPDSKQNWSKSALAYLVGARELNNDPTNFWVFTEVGLKRLFDRAGWEVAAYMTAGDTVASTPSSMEHDERAFALLRSKRRAT